MEIVLLIAKLMVGKKAVIHILLIQISLSLYCRSQIICTHIHGMAGMKVDDEGDEVWWVHQNERKLAHYLYSHPETQMNELLVPGDGNTTSHSHFNYDPSQLPAQSYYSKDMKSSVRKLPGCL